MEGSSDASLRRGDADEQPEITPPKTLQTDPEVRLQRGQLQSDTTTSPQAGSSIDVVAPDGNRSGRPDNPSDDDDADEGHNSSKDGLAADKNSTDDPAKTPNKFGGLPKELREMVWESAWCTRLVRPTMPQCPSPQLHNHGAPCTTCFMPLTYASARDPSTAFVNHEARECARNIAKPLSVWSRSIFPNVTEPISRRIF